MSVSAELDPVKLLNPPNSSIAELAFSLRTEKPRVDAYWSAARAQRYQLVTAVGSKTHKTKLIISPICRGAKRARFAGRKTSCDTCCDRGVMASFDILASVVVLLRARVASNRAKFAFLLAGDVASGVAQASLTARYPRAGMGKEYPSNCWRFVLYGHLILGMCWRDDAKFCPS